VAPWIETGVTATILDRLIWATVGVSLLVACCIRCCAIND